ncbi:MAG: nuclear transport factor 2 family protein [Akkermansiaceae bacterium]|nr:nuclear transport factor 2 family protein [Armatimonadota bacterium]
MSTQTATAGHTPEWITEMFAAIDRMDSRGYASYFTEDATWHFANSAPMYGHAEIRDGADRVFALLNGIGHEVRRAWTTADSAIVEGVVHYTRKDNTVISLPFASFYELRGEKIAAYRSYIDAAPLFAST